MSLNIISLGFVKAGEENPFIVKPTFGLWAPWIGPETRKSDVVLNTEWEKVHRPTKAKEQADLDIAEDRLLEEVMKMKVDDVKKLCRACGVDQCGSKTDLILRLHNEIRSRSTYDKIFEKVWGASGGWSTVMCPCGLVYSLKFNMRAESPRDYTDILFSWQHLPNVTIYDFARGLVTHANLRDPLMLPFAPHEGRLISPTEENISLAKKGKVKINLPWLTEPRNPPDINGHPTTGSSEHYVLYDKLHETNAKDPKDFLRRTALVPELAGKVNTQVVEQFFAQMEKSNYFLNTMSPSSQIFLIRNIIHHHNTLLNRSRLEKIQKSMGTEQTSMNKNGQLVIGHSQDSLNLDSVKVLQKDEDVTKLQNVSANFRCWQHPLSAELQKKVSCVLDETKDPKEHIVRVYGETLTREDFLSLGLQNNVEGMILNSCLRVVAKLGSMRNIEIWMISSYISVTWLPPLSANPMNHFPVDICNKDVIFLPSWTAGHWMIARACPKNCTRTVVRDRPK